MTQTAEKTENLTELKRQDQPLVFHFRIGQENEMDPKSGATVFFLPERRRFGVSLCCSKDRFQRSVGVKIACDRALTQGPIKTPKQPKRNSYIYDYSGPLTLQHIRAVAKGLVNQMAGAVNNRVKNYTWQRGVTDDLTRSVVAELHKFVVPVDKVA
jgi:hypothetical protein